MEISSVFLNLLSSYKYFLLFPGLVVEGPVLTFVAAFLASPGGGSLLNIYIVFILVLLADIVGDIMYYSIGRWGGKPLVERFGYKCGLTESKIQATKKYYYVHGKKTLAIAKISHGLGWPTMMTAGIINVPFLPFLCFTSMVSVIKSILLVAIGYVYGESYVLLKHYISLTGFIVTTVVAVILIVIIISLFNKKRNV
jgi:membrane protein DedA with SNARE-associated domain